MSNPEGGKMGKKDLFQIIESASEARPKVKQAHPEFLSERKSGTTPPPSTTEEHSQRASKAEKKIDLFAQMYPILAKKLRQRKSTVAGH